MQTYQIGRSPLHVSRIALGCMRLYDPETVVPVVRAALEGGINFFDHADIYGRGRSEAVFAALWQEFPGLRERIILQSKCGIRIAGDPTPDAVGRYDFSYEHIVRAVEGSLQRLQTGYLDVLLLHRPDPLIEPAEVARAFDHLQQTGKVRYFGVSNHSAAQIQLLQRWVDQPLLFNQLELNLVHTHLLDEGIVVNQDNPAVPVRNHGTLEFCRLQDITVQAWSPLAGGRLRAGSDDPRYRAAWEVVATLASDKGVSPETILIAWLLRHPAGIQPIVGTTNVERVKAMCAADTVVLTREEWYRLFVAGRGATMP